MELGKDPSEGKLTVIPYSYSTFCFGIQKSPPSSQQLWSAVATAGGTGRTRNENYSYGKA